MVLGSDVKLGMEVTILRESFVGVDGCSVGDATTDRAFVKIHRKAGVAVYAC